MFIKEKNELAKYAGKRKHFTQLQESETDGLWKRLRSIGKQEWFLIDHVYDRLNQKGIKVDKKDIINTVDNAFIIEYKIDHHARMDKYEERVVLRSRRQIQGGHNLHVVYSLTDKKIVSVWTNHKSDMHFNLDWTKYDANMKVFL